MDYTKNLEELKTDNARILEEHPEIKVKNLRLPGIMGLTYLTLPTHGLSKNTSHYIVADNQNRNLYPRLMMDKSERDWTQNLIVRHEIDEALEHQSILKQRYGDNPYTDSKLKNIYRSLRAMRQRATSSHISPNVVFRESENVSKAPDTVKANMMAMRTTTTELPYYAARGFHYGEDGPDSEVAKKIIAEKDHRDSKIPFINVFTDIPTLAHDLVMVPANHYIGNKAVEQLSSKFPDVMKHFHKIPSPIQNYLIGSALTAATMGTLTGVYKAIRDKRKESTKTASLKNYRRI